MDNQIEKVGSNNQPERSLDEEWRLMNAALERLGRAKPLPARPSGRLIVILDLTGSREASLAHARIATAGMFEAIKTVGAVAVKLIYYRGSRECKASGWHDDAGVVSRSMLRLSCSVGATQIARTLRLVLQEKERVSGVVFVGDHCEEDADELLGLARALGKRSAPLFVFHECADHDERSLHAKPIFEDMAVLSGGVYVEFKANSGAVLREMLSSVAAFSAAGHEGVKQAGTAKTPEARQLRSSLLMLSDGNPGRFDLLRPDGPQKK